MRQRSTVALILALVAFGGLTSSAEPLAQARHISSFRWVESDDAFGGFSAIEVAPDGLGFIAVSDRGNLLRGAFTRHEGAITGITSQPMQVIASEDGHPLRPRLRDPEGLAIADNGEMFISYEGRARVWAHDPVDLKARPLPEHPDFKSMQLNSSLEALAIDSRGHLFTLPERSGGENRAFPVYRFDGTVWDQPFALSRSDGFLPVGADFGPDGWLYLLERNFTGLGFRSRVRRFDVTGDRVNSQEVLFFTATGRHDNLEGLSVWQDETGMIRLTMVSDDNFRFFQRTEIVEYAAPPAPQVQALR